MPSPVARRGREVGSGVWETDAWEIDTRPSEFKLEFTESVKVYKPPPPNTMLKRLSVPLVPEMPVKTKVDPTYIYETAESVIPNVAGPTLTFIDVRPLLSVNMPLPLEGTVIEKEPPPPSGPISAVSVTSYVTVDARAAVGTCAPNSTKTASNDAQNRMFNFQSSAKLSF